MPTHAAVWQAENEPVLDGGNPPRPIRHFRLAERRTPDRNSSQVPVHSALVQKSVATNTNLAGRLSVFDAREFRSDAQGVVPKKMAERLLNKSREGGKLGVAKSRNLRSRTGDAALFQHLIEHVREADGALHIVRGVALYLTFRDVVLVGDVESSQNGKPHAIDG